LQPIVTKSNLSLSQQRLVELFQKLNFGRIEALKVRSGEPAFDRPPRIIQKLKMGGENGPRPETSLDDFRLNRQTIELFETIAKVGDGEILSIEVKNGLAFAVEVERPNGALDE
jgi:hypothetical protein